MSYIWRWSRIYEISKRRSKKGVNRGRIHFPFLEDVLPIIMGSLTFETHGSFVHEGASLS